MITSRLVRLGVLRATVLGGLMLSASAFAAPMYMFQDLGTLPGGRTSVGMSINDAGQVAGYSHDTGLSNRATVWNGTTATNLGTLTGGTESAAYAINNAGQVAGYSNGTGIIASATVWNGTTATNLGMLFGDYYSEARGINDVGQIVGNSFRQSRGNLAVLWDDGEIFDLNSLIDSIAIDAGWILTQALDINENGLITGNAFNSVMGQTHAFLLTPIAEASDVPEPGSLALLGVSLAGLAAVRKRKSQQG